VTVLERILTPPLRKVHEIEPQPRRFNCSKANYSILISACGWGGVQVILRKDTSGHGEAVGHTLDTCRDKDRVIPPANWGYTHAIHNRGDITSANLRGILRAMDSKERRTAFEFPLLLEG
jgi:hypothetical protein